MHQTIFKLELIVLIEFGRSKKSWSQTFYINYSVNTQQIPLAASVASASAFLIFAFYKIKTMNKFAEIEKFRIAYYFDFNDKNGSKWFC